MKKRRQFRRWLSLFCLLALLAAPAVPAAAAEQPDRWAQAEVAQAVELGLVPADLAKRLRQGYHPGGILPSGGALPGGGRKGQRLGPHAQPGRPF